MVRLADVSAVDQVNELFAAVQTDWGRLDVLVNNVGVSDRGQIESLGRDRMIELIDANVTTTLLCCQAAMPMLESSGGCVVNVGSLAAKTAPRFLGGYAIAKHALAALSEQLRLEWRDRGIHVGIVCPGPIRREDAGTRYEIADDRVPHTATAPGGGAKLSGLPPERVAAAVLRCARKRLPVVVLPFRARLLFIVGEIFPRLGDWLLVKFTSG